MGRRTTIEDVARKAGVSVATVDRVLNRRRPVRPATAEAVLNAAKELAFYATPLIRQRHRGLAPVARLGVLLQKRAKPFYQEFAERLQAAAERQPDVRAVLRIDYVEEVAPLPIARRLAELGAESDAVAIVSVDDPRVEEVINRLRDRGVPTLSLLSALSAPRLAGHVGVDAHQAGRIAAWGIVRCAPAAGPVGILIGSGRYAGQETRLAGFRRYLRERGAGFSPCEPLPYLDEDAGAYGTALELMQRSPGIVGLYVIGGGASGAVRAIEEMEWTERMALVCAELGPATLEGLRSGSVDMAVATSVRGLAETAVESLASLARDPDTDIGCLLLPSAIYISENT